MSPPSTGTSNKKPKTPTEEKSFKKAPKTAPKTPLVPENETAQAPGTSGGGASRKASMQASIKTYTPESDEVFLRRSQSTASRKTQTSLDMIEKDVERIKAQIKTGDDINTQEVLQAVLLMLDDMRYNMKLLKELKREHTPDVEVIESDQAGEKHSLMNINVKGIKKNLAALKMFNELRPSPSFIVVTETWNQDLDQAQIAGYHDPIFKTRIKVVGGGGVGIYVKSSYEKELCEKLTSIEYKVKHLEFVAVEVSLEDFWKVLIIGIFRPTGKTPTDILKELELIFKTALDTKLPVIIAGDFNIDVTNVNDALAKKYAALVNKYNLRMLVREPTRISSKSNALLDHILTNEEMTSEVTATVLDCQIAEHQVTIAEWY